MKHLGVLKNSFECVCPIRSRSNWNLEMLISEETGKPEYPKKNLQEQGRESNQLQTKPKNDTDTQGFAPGLHWWEVGALTTAPFLLSREIARANGTYLIFLSFVNATTIAVSLTFPSRVQNLASFTEATFLARTAARSRRVDTCLFTAAWIIFFSFSLTVFL